MQESLKPIAEMLSLNNNLFNTSFEKLGNEQGRKQFDSDTNNVTWLLAHLVSGRHFIGALMGIQKETPWEGEFNKNIAEIDASKFPELQEVKEAWSDISAAVTARLPELTEQDLAGEPPNPFPTSEQTILAAITFLTQHESYHLGQVSYIRRLLREEGLYKVLFNAGN